MKKMDQGYCFAAILTCMIGAQSSVICLKGLEKSLGQ